MAVKQILAGLGASPGQAKGKVRIVKGFEDFEKFSEGDVLVAKITDPTMVVIMGKAAGIICDIGGLTSHPSIVSREMGTPCIVSAKCPETGKAATEILEEGMEVILDGKTGEVFIAEEVE